MYLDLDPKNLFILVILSNTISNYEKPLVKSLVSIPKIKIMTNAFKKRHFNHSHPFSIVKDGNRVGRNGFQKYQTQTQIFWPNPNPNPNPKNPKL